ncbi:hypothetical protein D5S17_14710 [Pseudonocardiaceae bacterium YIM PH 21723]|nr:hypothetical protein D5S17_14710 [Pseudonocardiaceae bacterium YIM PH 21723]
MANEPLWVVEARVSTDFNQFMLFDVESELRYDELQLPAGAWLGVSGPGGALFHTHEGNFKADVRLEFWPRPSPDLAAQTQNAFFGEFTAPTGGVMLGSVTGSPSDRFVQLPGPGTYQVRAERVADRLVQDSVDQIDSAEGWLLQVAPAG